MAENERGFHHPRQVNFDRGAGPSEGGGPPHGAPHRHMAEPTNHAGHTHEMARRSESDARIERHRGSHDDHAMGKHERILHDTHKLHQGHEPVSQSKHGASHYIRAGEGEAGEESPAHERRESAAERRRERE